MRGPGLGWKKGAERLVPVADEDFIGIEASFSTEEFRELRVAGKKLVGGGPFVVGEIVIPRVIDGDLREGTEGVFGILHSASGVFHTEIEDHAGPGFACPRQE